MKDFDITCRYRSIKKQASINPVVSVMKFLYLVLVIFFASASYSPARQWERLDTGTDADLNDIYFVDRTIGWIVGSNGTILFTQDGGETWTQQESRTTNQLNSVHFFDEFTGWIAGDDNLVLVTSDGGERWSERRPSPVSGQHLNDIYFSNLKNGWTAGGPGGHIYYSGDRGSTWQRQALLSPDSTIQAIRFVDQSKGKVVYGNRIHHTNNGGESWNLSNAIAEDESFSVVDIWPHNDTAGWVVGNLHNDGLILKTNDGGKNWEEAKRMPGTDIRSIHFADDSTGGILAASGYLLQTKNGGEDWTKVEVSSSALFKDLFYSDPGAAWVAGDNGGVYRFRDQKLPDISTIKGKYKKVQVEEEQDAIELLERSREYGSGALEKSDPAARFFHYGRMLGGIRQAEQYYENREMPEEIASFIQNLLNHHWSEEYNDGAELFNESLEQDYATEIVKRAELHLCNAIILLPDSIHSYISLARVEEALGNRSGAISTMEKAFDRMNQPETGHYNLLIDLYLAEGMEQKAVNFAEEAAEFYPGELHYYELLADWYIESGNPELAITWLDTLIEYDTTRPGYYEKRGRQYVAIAMESFEESLELYEEVWERREELFTDPNGAREQQLRSEIDRLEREAENLEQDGAKKTNQAIFDLQQVTELRPNEHPPYGLLGMIHQNKASLLYEMSTLIHDPERSRELDQQVDPHLQKAMLNYEKATELNPDITTYWESLYNIYLNLGLEEKAVQVMNERNL